MRVSSSAWYDWLRAEPRRQKREKELEAVRSCMCRLHIDHRRKLGSRRMRSELSREGFEMSRHTVRRLMKRRGIRVSCRRRKVMTTDSRHSRSVADNVLNRQFDAAHPNRVWSTDITCLPARIGWLYLAVVLDLHSRKVAGWHVSDSMETALVVRALSMAVNLHRPPKGLLHHSDRGSQYASGEYQNLLREHGTVCSMSRKSNCIVRPGQSAGPVFQVQDQCALSLESGQKARLIQIDDDGEVPDAG